GMHDPFFVNVLHAKQRLMHDERGLRNRQPPAALQDFFQRFAFQMLHDEEMNAIRLADRKGPDDMGMLHLDREARLALEPAEKLRFFRPRRRQDLERHRLAARGLSAVYAGHSPFADSIEDLVLVDEIALVAAMP